MSNQDNNATIQCVSAVIRAHMIDAARSNVTPLPEYDTFKDSPTPTIQKPSTNHHNNTNSNSNLHQISMGNYSAMGPSNNAGPPHHFPSFNQNTSNSLSTDHSSAGHPTTTYKQSSIHQTVITSGKSVLSNIFGQTAHNIASKYLEEEYVRMHYDS